MEMAKRNLLANGVDERMSVNEFFKILNENTGDRMFDVEIEASTIRRNVFGGSSAANINNTIRSIIVRGIDTIPNYSFTYSSNLERAIFPDATSVSTASSSVTAPFGNCPSLKELRIPNVKVMPYLSSMTSGDIYVGGYGNTSATSITGTQKLSPENDIVIHLEGVTKIPDYDFSYADNARIVVAPDCESIGNYAFRRNNAGTSLRLTVKRISAENYSFSNLGELHLVVLAEDGAGSFSKDVLKSVLAPNLKTLDSMYRSSNLEYVDMPECEAIAGNAFEGCTSLKHVNFPKVRRISGNSVFSGAMSMEELDFPSLEYVSAYIGDTGIKKFVFKNKVEIEPYYAVFGSNRNLSEVCFEKPPIRVKNLFNVSQKETMKVIRFPKGSESAVSGLQGFSGNFGLGTDWSGSILYDL